MGFHKFETVGFSRFLTALLLLCFASGHLVCYGAQPDSEQDYDDEKPVLIAADGDSSGRGQQEETIGVTKNEIVLGSCAPLTGVIQKHAEALIDGATSYISSVNDKGGIYGRKIKLVSCDDAFSPDKAVDCFNSCLKDKVFSGAFFMGASAVVKYVRMGDASRMPMVGFNVGIPVTCEFGPSRFNLRPCFGDEIHTQIHELVDLRHVSKIGIIYQSDALGTSARQAVLEELRKRGMAPVAEASCTRASSQCEEPYNQVKSHHPQAVIVAAGTPTLQSLIQKRNKEKWGATFLTLSQLGDVLSSMGRDAEGVVTTQVVPRLDLHLPAILSYTQLLKKYHPNAKPEIHGLEAFLNAMVIVEALKRAGPEVTRTKFLKALESMHGFDLGLGTGHRVNFSATRHVAWDSSAVSLEIMRGGHLEPIKEEDWVKLMKDSDTAAASDR
jgi:ABC-type branched-subunit amino acid transport system substrate-binding protein